MSVPERRRDASMDLLRLVRESALDPAYAEAAAHARPRRRRSQLGLAVVATVLGVTMGSMGATLVRLRPESSTQRVEMINRIRKAEIENAGRRDRNEIAQRELDQLRAQQLGLQGSGYQKRLEEAEHQSGASPITGQGIVVTIDDAPEERVTDSTGRVLDVDLRRVVNGLWQSGAEAIAINGHRLTATTAIRSAGNAITVGYRSLDRPYRIEIVGDSKLLPARFSQTPGGSWLTGLGSNYGVRYSIVTSQELTLPGRPATVLRHVKEN